MEKKATVKHLNSASKKMQQPIEFENKFIMTKNVRNFEVMMNTLTLSAGEGRLALVYSRAGRGKTRTAQRYAAHHGCIYLRMATVWSGSEVSFLRALVYELGEKTPPYRKGACYLEIIERLINYPQPIFLDELEKLPGRFLDIVRDISDMAAVPIIIIGEEETHAYMRRNRRVWSRTFEQLEFEPVSEGDIITYAKSCAGIDLSHEVAVMLNEAADGDIRLVRRDLLKMIALCNAKGSEPTLELARIAIQEGLYGQ